MAESSPVWRRPQRTFKIGLVSAHNSSSGQLIVATWDGVGEVHRLPPRDRFPVALNRHDFFREWSVACGQWSESLHVYGIDAEESA
jgi:hypothetical protein